MGSPEILDFKKLLARISDESPSGVELRDDPNLISVFYAARDARNAARDAERRLREYQMLPEDIRDGEPKPDAPDWRSVFDVTTKVVAENSKDLWCVAWLTESLTRLHGFAGLRDGCRLARELCETYWEGIHPQPDEEGYSTTVAQFTGLNGEDSEGALIPAIDAIRITDDVAQGPYNSSDYIDAIEIEKLTDSGVRERRIRDGAVTLDMLNQAVNASSPEFYRDLLADVDQAIDEFQKLTAVLDERCGENAEGYPTSPPSSNIINALRDCRDRITSISKHLLVNDSAEASASDGGGLIGDSGEDAFEGTRGKVNTREDAFQALLQVAEYFRRTEPHSPVSYALEQAVRWGRMSLPELMSELIADDSARKEFFRMTGVSATDDSEN